MSSDKLMHFGACLGISLIAAVTVSILGSPRIASLITGLFAGMSAGLAKEYGDKCSPTNCWDWKDVIADLVGTLFGSIIGCIL